MSVSAIDRACEKYGCARVFLDPKLHAFDHCFAGFIRMGDVDAAVERNGHVLWVEWKRGAILDGFERIHGAQVRMARAFTRNSDRQTVAFVMGCPVEMTVDRFRIMRAGDWRWGWQDGGRERFEAFLRHWFAVAEGRARWAA